MPFSIIQLKSWYLVYRPTEGRRLSRHRSMLVETCCCIDSVGNYLHCTQETISPLACLSVCEQDYCKSRTQIFVKFVRGVGRGTLGWILCVIYGGDCVYSLTFTFRRICLDCARHYRLCEVGLKLTKFWVYLMYSNTIFCLLVSHYCAKNFINSF